MSEKKDVSGTRRILTLFPKKADAESKEDENQNETVSARMEQEVSSSIPDYNTIKDTTEPDDEYSIEIPEDDSDDMEDTL